MIRLSEMQDSYKIILSIGLLVLAVGVTVFFQSDGDGVASDYWLKCIDLSCNYSEKISQDKRGDMIRERNEVFLDKLAVTYPKEAEQLREVVLDPSVNIDRMAASAELPLDLLPSWGAVRNYPFVCPECGKNSFYSAMQCASDKCDEVFGVVGRDFKTRDKCPKCGYSRLAELRKERRAEDKKKRGGRK